VKVNVGGDVSVGVTVGVNVLVGVFVIVGVYDGVTVGVSIPGRYRVMSVPVLSKSGS
jgi:hypothetical protein